MSLESDEFADMMEEDVFPPEPDLVETYPEPPLVDRAHELSEVEPFREVLVEIEPETEIVYASEASEAYPPEEVLVYPREEPVRYPVEVIGDPEAGPQGSDADVEVVPEPSLVEHSAHQPFIHPGDTIHQPPYNDSVIATVLFRGRLRDRRSRISQGIGERERKVDLGRPRASGVIVSYDELTAEHRADTHVLDEIPEYLRIGRSLIHDQDLAEFTIESPLHGDRVGATRQTGMKQDFSTVRHRRVAKDFWRRPTQIQYHRGNR